MVGASSISKRGGMTTYTNPHNLPIIEPNSDKIKDGAEASALAGDINSLAMAAAGAITSEGSRVETAAFNDATEKADAAAWMRGVLGEFNEFKSIDEAPDGFATIWLPSNAEFVKAPENIQGFALTVRTGTGGQQIYLSVNGHIWHRKRKASVWDANFRRIDGRLELMPENEDLLVWTDSAGQYTDLHLGPDGYFAAPVIERLQDRILSGMSMVEAPESGVAFAIVDKVGQYTDLHLDDSGQFADEVLERVGTRLGTMGLGGGLNKHDMMYLDGHLLPAYPDTGNVTCWGSSSMQGLAPHLLSTFKSATVHNEGKGGEWSQQIAARMGAIPALLTVLGGSIPASGSVLVTASNVPPLALMKDFAGTLNGVHGTLSSNGTTQTFTRTSPGSATEVPSGTPFISEVGNASRQHITMLWPGKNNLKTVGAVPLVIEQTEMMFAWLSPMLIKRCVVLTHFVDSDQSPGSTQHNQVAQVNADYLARYGSLCIDANAYILSPQVWADTGIMPTAADLQMQSNGVKATSLSSDNLHLNDTAEAALAGFVRQHLQNLQWV